MKELEKILNIVPSDVMTRNQPLQPSMVPKEEVHPEDPDYDFARLNLYSIIEQGKQAMEGALRVAEQSEHPRAYEVVGTLLKNMADINKQLLLLGKDREDVKIARKGNSGNQSAPIPGTIHNTAVFIGNSSDLNKIIADRMKSSE